MDILPEIAQKKEGKDLQGDNMTGRNEEENINTETEETMVPDATIVKSSATSQETAN